MTNKVKIGDIFEVATSKGLTYCQYTHQHGKWGGLIRILEGFYSQTISFKELAYVVNKPHRFSTFFPVKMAIKQNIFQVVANYPVPEFAQGFPIFKNTISLPDSDPTNAIWWLWDGKKEWKAGKLSLEDQDKYPEKVIYNDTGLIQAIETGMTGKRKLC